MRVVVDTNVFVSGLINPRGAPGAIVDAVIEGRITPVFSSETLAALHDVLARPRLQRFLSCAAIPPEALLARLAKAASEAIRTSTPKRPTPLERLRSRPSPKCSLFMSRKLSSICIRWR